MFGAIPPVCVCGVHGENFVDVMNGKQGARNQLPDKGKGHPINFYRDQGGELDI
jgi:hypothetical protein